MKLVFIFGSGNYKNLNSEIEKYDDILIGDFDESFHNLTFKDSLLFTWAKNDCPSSFIMKE